jgi:hypothetical protein
MYKVVALRPHCSSQLIHQLPSLPIALLLLNTMTAFIHKSKVVLLEHMKSLPDAHIAEEEDFVAWGRQFVDIVVSRKELGGVDATNTKFA